MLTDYISPADGAPPDPPITLQAIAADTRSFDDAYSGRPADNTHPFGGIKSSYDSLGHGGFTPAGLSRNQFSGMLSTAQEGAVPPMGNNDRRPRPASAGGAFGDTEKSNRSRPISASAGVSIGNKLYNTVRQAQAYSIDDDDDDDEMGPMNIHDDINEMIIDRKDRDKGINGVGGLLEQQIRKLQLTQPMSDVNGDRDHGKGLSRKKMTKAVGGTPKKFSTPDRQKQMASVYTSPVVGPTPTTDQFSTPDRARKSAGAAKADETAFRDRTGIAAIKVMRRVKSAGLVRPPAPSASSAKMSQSANYAGGMHTAPAGPSSAKLRPSSAKTSELPTKTDRKTRSAASLPAVEPSGAHHDLLQTKIQKLNLNPALLF
jgi:hypothetical protein